MTTPWPTSTPPPVPAPPGGIPKRAAYGYPTVSYDDAEANAAAALDARDHLGAIAYTLVAREIREAGASAPARYATQDIQLRHCHCATHVVRLGDTGRWWHPGSKTHCDDEAPTEIQPTPPVREPGTGRVVMVPKARFCRHCASLVKPTPGRQPGPPLVWTHVSTGGTHCIGYEAYAEPVDAT